jgi:ferredoxin
MNSKEESAAAVDKSIDKANAEDRPLEPDADETLAEWRASSAPGAGPEAENPSPLPHFPAVEPLAPKELQATLLAARRFHRGDPDPEQALRPVSDKYLPALLFPFRNTDAIRHDYPLYLFPGLKKETDPIFEPLPDLLRRVLADIASEPEEMRILRDNLARVEHHVRRSVAGATAPVDINEPLRRAVEQAARDLKLSDDNAERLRLDGDRLLEALPEGGQLLALTPFTPLQLFLHAARLRGRTRRRGLKAKVDQLRTKLQDQLIIALGKDPEGRQTSQFLGMIGTVGSKHVDPEALTRIIGPQRGVQPMNPDRKHRIERVLGIFEKFLSKPEPIFAHVVHRGQVPDSAQISLVGWHDTDEQAVCAATAQLFDKLAHEYAELFGAMRVAELDLADAYESPRHDVLLDSFDWEAFSHEELRSVPPVMALESAEHLAGSGMLCVSRLLLSGRPVSIMVPVQAAANVGMPPDADPLLGYRLELGYLGVSHREAAVNQTSATRPEHLATSLERALDGTRTALHVVACGTSANGKPPRVGAWLYGGAALEGRAHPFFHYDPEAGDSWAKRFRFDANPQPDRDWPVYNLPCLAERGEEKTVPLTFTFADFALAEERYREHFAVVPNGCVSDDLVPVDEFLRLGEMEAYGKLPFVWAVDEAGALRQLVITRRLAFACRDRMAYWHLLQELGGVRSEYIDKAVEEERKRLQGEFDAEREKLRAEMRAQVEEVRKTAADDILQRLAESLLNTDVTRLASAAGMSAPRASTAAAPAEPTTESKPDQQPAAAEAAPEPVEEDDDDEPQEPWVSSILCTSCNDCVQINPQVFVYNESKQVKIGDPRAGTYEQIVRAAEKCPSRCIHPGQPLNPDEPNLEALKKRAKPFN